jgi:hypothetical protein
MLNDSLKRSERMQQIRERPESAVLQKYPIHPSYNTRARPRTPAAPATLIAIPVGAAPPSVVVDEAEPDAEDEAEDEDEAASELVAEEEDEPVIVEEESAEVDSAEDEAPELEAPELGAEVEVASALLGLELLPPSLVIFPAMDDAKEG